MELIVLKDDAKRLVTGPVAIPDCPDCDYPRGEKLLSVDEIERMVHEYNTRSQLADAMHVYGATKQTIGVAVENWTLKEPTTVKNIKGDTVSLPRGTWMTTIKVTDDATWERIQDGTYKGFSASYMSRDAAEEVLSSKRVLIADLVDPIPVTISIVDEPCVFDATFCSIKQDEDVVDKAGRRFSNATLKKIQGAFESLQNLINDALAERGETEADKDILEDVSMNEDELKAMIQDAVKEALKEEQKEPEAEEAEEEVEEVEETIEAEAEPSEAEKKLEEAQAEIEALKTKLGEGESQKIEGQDEEKPEADKDRALKFEFEDRDAFGCKIHKE